MTGPSIVVPVLDEAAAIDAHLDALSAYRRRGAEVIVVDGGSRDATVPRARARADQVISAPRGRALQMNAGAEKACGDVLLFLHADTRLPADADHIVLDLRRPTAEDHAAIVDALRSGDRAAMTRAVDRHFEDLQRSLDNPA